MQKFAIPLLLISALIHWLVSQSIFLARITVLEYTAPGHDVASGDPSVTTCGYSSIALIFSIIVGVVMLVCVLAAGFWGRLKPGIPLGGDCSLVVSAACHSEGEGDDVGVMKVKWGALRREEGVEHCGFSSKDVSFPVDGKVYA